LFFDFTAPKEQPLTTIPSFLLRQVVGGLEKVPANIVQTFRAQKEAAMNRQLKLNLTSNHLNETSFHPSPFHR